MQSIPPSQPNPVWAGIHTLTAQTREPEPDFKQLFFFYTKPRSFRTAKINLI